MNEWATDEQRRGMFFRSTFTVAAIIYIFGLEQQYILEYGVK